MLISFLRHAEAEDMATSDFDRKLTAKGLEQAAKVGSFCARNGMVPDIVLTSPVVRAEQTARIVARKLGDIETVVVGWAACGMSPGVCCEELRGFQKFENVLLVGHEPDFGETIAAMIGLPNAGALQVRKASLTMVDLRAFRAGAGRLEFTLPVRLM